MATQEQAGEGMEHARQTETVLAELEVTNQLEAAFEAMADGLFLYDAHGRLVRTNPAGRELLGGEERYRSPSSSLQEGAQRFQLRDPRLGDPLTETQWPVTRLLQGEAFQMVDVLLHTLDGQERILSLSGAPMRDSQGHIIGGVISVRDVTEYRYLERRMQMILDAFLQMAQITVQGGSPVSPSTSGEIYSSQRVAQQLAELAREMLGCQRLGLTIVEPQTEIQRPLAVVGLTPEQEVQWWAEQQQQENRFGDGLSPDFIERLRHNEVLLFDLRQPPWNEFPNPYGIVTMLLAPLCLQTQVVGLLSLDYGGKEHHYTPQEIALTQAVTQLLALAIQRERLHSSNQRLSELIAQAHDAIILRAPDGLITFWNRGAERLYGWKAEQAMGRISHTLLHTHFPISQEQVDTQLAEEGQWEGELVHQDREGNTVVVESRQVVVRDEASHPPIVLEINRDITERKRLLTQRAEAEANEQAAQETARLMDEFLGIAGHELRTPLTTIKASIQLAKRHMTRVLTPHALFSEETKHYLRLISDALERMERQVGMQTRLISDLLDVSRLHANQLELSLEVCDLVLLVREVLDDQRFLYPTRTLNLTYSETNKVLVLGDKDRLRQVIQNYLSNALKYSEENTPVTIRIEPQEAEAYVGVTDQGPGLSQEEQHHIWTRFYRVTGIGVKSGSGVGLGLGLYICRNLVERQGGRVGVESRQGEGATFWLRLPLIQ